MLINENNMSIILFCKDISLVTMLLVITLTVLAFLFGILQILTKFIQWNKVRNIVNLIPGPKTDLFLGNIKDVIGPQDHTFKEMRKYLLGFKDHDVSRFWLGHLPMINTFDPDVIELAISTTKHNSKSEPYELLHCWIGTGLLTSNGEKWHSRRKILTPSFHFSILQEFLPVFVNQTKVLINTLKYETNKTIDIVPLITQFTLHSVCETAMGISLSKMDNQEKYKYAIYRMGEYMTYRLTRPWFFYDIIFAITKHFWHQRHLAKFVQNFSRSVIEKKKAKILDSSIKDDVHVAEQSYSKRKQMAMLDMLLTAKLKGAPIDDEGIREEVDTFMFEGHDTTSMSICFSLMLFACNRTVQDKIYEEIKMVLSESDREPTFADLQELKYLERCIKESLRLYPSVPLISREVTQNITTPQGYVVPKGVAINMHIFDAHRNPKIYENPLIFNPDRFLPEATKNRHPFAYIPFSAGPRNCIGQRFAIMELKIVLMGIIKNYILEPVDTPDSLVLITDLVLRSKNGVKLKLIQRTAYNST